MAPENSFSGQAMANEQGKETPAAGACWFTRDPRPVLPGPYLALTTQGLAVKNGCAMKARRIINQPMSGTKYFPTNGVYLDTELGVLK